jgi:iron-sulfur cluster assembly protein
MTVTGNTTNKHLDFTDSAQKHIKSLLDGKDKAAIRIGIRDSGCSGYAYFLEFADRIESNDLEFSFEDFKVLIDEKSFTFINGTTVDFIKEGVNSNLTFINPNVSAQCGCGESFSI